jgi:hypothetical protein
MKNNTLFPPTAEKLLRFFYVLEKLQTGEYDIPMAFSKLEEIDMKIVESDIAILAEHGMIGNNHENS